MTGSLSPIIKIINFMERLKESFKLNKLQYTLLKRNDVVALFGIGGTYTDKAIHYEVSKIHIRKADNYCNYDRESVPNNDQFIRDGSRCFNDLETAEYYFDKLTEKVKRLQVVPKAVTGAKQKGLDMFGYQAA